ncbi:MAG: HTTM domain-containing protein [Salibacteraceae bacterium]
MGIKRLIHSAVFKQVTIAPLVTFRVLVGLIMFASVVRFWMNGWIEAQYIEPLLHFKYFGFHWLPEPSALGYYVIFGAMALSALGITFGALYRVSAVAFFLLFTYIELIDVTYYLNHYYFVSLVAGIMVFLPAHAKGSIDAWLGLVKQRDTVAAGNINIIKFQLALVYLFAGIAKLNADWLIHAMPLAIWLPAQDQLPVIGAFFRWEITPYLMSWAGALYDLTIPFLLLFSRTRWVAYAAVIAFHMLTWWLFPIGMFPFIMIAATLIFFSGEFHQRLQQRLFGWSWKEISKEDPLPITYRWYHLPVALFVLVQLTFPMRHLLYEGNPFWHEQGYRFGWRVMLTEKAGYAQFNVVNNEGNSIEVDNRDFLTPVQEKMMSTQPDLMIQYAQFLQQHYTQKGVHTVGVYANAYVTYNGRPSRPFIDHTVNLAAQQDSWQPKPWILPFES